MPHYFNRFQPLPPKLSRERTGGKVWSRKSRGDLSTKICTYCGKPRATVQTSTVNGGTWMHKACQVKASEP